MDILVNGEVKELTAVGLNGAEWTEDLLGGYTIPSFKYDHERDIYIMSAEDYEWWGPVVDKLNSIAEMEEELSDSELEEYHSEDSWFGGFDLEGEINLRFDWLTEKLGLSSKNE